MNKTSDFQDVEAVLGGDQEAGVTDSAGPFKSELKLEEACGWGRSGNMYYLRNTVTNSKVTVTIKILTKAGNDQGRAYQDYRLKPGERKPIMCSLSGESPTSLSHHQLTISGEVFG
ncbi:hypothetical protein JYG35_12845 [Pseudomonas rhodesiae]|uniref:hypothetical protein n=1 Tax=Pseudomonas rhodesiae TaxID=76760 RepID=UPI001BCB4116|nr:hypothetical protein [Pseudomonas rhodesiae]QVN09515.1 hypothetical protein JYG35_12845 [Pseudomonas rhodesiae]